jgi:hypothetical protein
MIRLVVDLLRLLRSEARETLLGKIVRGKVALAREVRADRDAASGRREASRQY